MQLGGYVDTLRTVGNALVAAYAVARLTEFRHTAVVPHKKSAARPAEVFVLNIFGDISLVETFVVVQQNGRYVESVGAWHAVFAVVTRNSVVLHHLGSRILQEAEIIGGKRLQGSIGAQIILKMLHAGHAAEHGHHARQASGKTESPRSHTLFRLAFLEATEYSGRHVGEPASQQRLHDYGRNAAFVELTVEVFGIGVARIDLPGIFPVKIVELNLHEIPFEFIVSGEQIIKHFNIAVVRKTEIAYASGLALLKQIVEHTVFHIPVLKAFHSFSGVAHAYAVKEQVIDIVDLQLFERVFVHLNGCFAAPCFGCEV